MKRIKAVSQYGFIIPQHFLSTPIEKYARYNPNIFSDLWQLFTAAPPR